MERIEKIHPVLEAIIMDAALKAVDVLMTNVRKIRFTLSNFCVVKFHGVKHLWFVPQ